MIKIVNHTNCGRCSNCGECCTDILPLNEEEIIKIKQYMKNHKLTENNKEVGNFICPFRNEVLKKCDIYEVRPYICQMFKCDTPPEEAEFRRDEITKTRKIYSMKHEFFDNDDNIFLLKKTGIIDIFNKLMEGIKHE